MMLVEDFNTLKELTLGVAPQAKDVIQVGVKRRWAVSPWVNPVLKLNSQKLNCLSRHPAHMKMEIEEPGGLLPWLQVHSGLEQS
ncbi:hypothetical protein AALO_G00074420 [Alosa alosa]|uniref:Uncharacterized protein n=1 Tax=Alosa alosa TaxID=278164 RepID=A0AAV6GVI3_9TELE|nr:hypothetical protein AALO_G00074420 [Alosa alosa]